MDPLVGQIQLFPYLFNMVGWMKCEGQVLTITQNQVLFSLIGNNYPGGDGRNTFALPNLKGAEPLPGMEYFIASEGLYPQRS
jgi:microcystin-dependent protein